ncbi:cytidine deaminase-like protein [Kalaharituber pfeilii]|nr:cytidine deaminase-like protein [Kalaharituber pfeilii]
MEDRKPDVDIETMEGKLMPLKTYMEHKAAVETTEVYTVPVPAKKANVVVSALREALPPQNKSGIDLQHLRRLVREEFLPRHVLTRMHSTAIINALAAKRVQKPNILHLLIAPTTAISLSTLYNVLRPLLFPVFPEISTIEVPLHASISQEQADEWSVTYWPAIHKRGNPFGPHPPYVDQTINRTLPRVAEYMALVKEAAKQAVACGNGIEVGAMVVDPSNEEVIAIAGDGRNMTFGGDEKERGCTWGNPLEHAIMRVVGMVAEKRKLREEFEIGTKVNVQEGVRIMRERENTLRYIPSTDIERKYFYNITPKDIGEYLCHNHIVYATHEPCVMCSMALIHSRIGMVVINGRHKATRAGWGGLYNLTGSGYGLFWRKELNWKFLAFEWIDNNKNFGEEIEGHDFYV